MIHARQAKALAKERRLDQLEQSITDREVLRRAEVAVEKAALSGFVRVVIPEQIPFECLEWLRIRGYAARWTTPHVGTTTIGPPSTEISWEHS